ncbi:hypothetical protein Tco_0325293, partial [Tanacetum coccineum]
MMARGVPNLAKRDLRNLQTTRASYWWGAPLLQPVIDNHKYVFVASFRRWERSYEIDAPNVKDFTNLDGILRHLIPLPKESGIKDLFGDEICTMMSPGRSIVASFENVTSFLAVYTPPDHLIRTNFKQEGVIPEVV